jgi:hypothetical protein
MSTLRLEAAPDKKSGEIQSELFAQLGSHEVFTPIKPEYPPMTISEMAAMGRDETELKAQ